ncbi:hypothetical protein [Martelella limonii]|uniref:hypothetical protein n=1 Tax=Martelella limonii TaxID=1647649 RepID=UPI0015809031|nr:hypothetical protein [Martelella limonii]
MYRFCKAACFLALLLPVACSTLGDPSEAVRAQSPLSADPHALLVALTKPAALAVGDGDLALALSWAVPGRSLMQEQAGLEVARRIDVAPGRDTVALVLAPDDADSMSALLAEIRDDRQAGVEGKGAFSVSFTARCVEGGADLSDMAVDVTLMLRPDEPPIALMKGAPFGALLAARGIDRLPDCAALKG